MWYGKRTIDRDLTTNGETKVRGCCDLLYRRFPIKRRIGRHQNVKPHIQLSPDDTWDDVLGDLQRELDDGYRLGKSDSVEVCLSSKKDATEIFFPYYKEKIDVIKQFDKSLKYVTFKITKFSTECRC